MVGIWTRIGIWRSNSPQGGHHWRLVTPDDPASVMQWGVYVYDYQMASNSPNYGEKGRPNKMYQCKVCRILVSEKGPRELDALCSIVIARQVMES